MNFAERMNSVLDYIENNLDGGIVDEKIAALSANTKGMFQRIFTMITDMTLSEYIRKRKLTQAASDIQNTDAKIIDVAVKYGYNSAEYFASAFKSFHGVTPSDARNANIEIQSFKRLTFHPNLTITGGNNNMQYRTISLDETIYFWLRSDSPILDNLLNGKMKLLWEAADRANANAKAMLSEFESGKRALDEKEIVRYKNRIYETLDDEAKDNIIKIAKIDIANLLGAMKPAKKEMLLCSIQWCAMLLKDYNLPRYDVNDIVEFKNLSSASIAPYNENQYIFGNYELTVMTGEPAVSKDFYRYEITIPKNAYVLQLDEYEEYSKNWYEKGEVILPPMKCRVKNICKSDNERCKGIIEFEYLERLPDPV